MEIPKTAILAKANTMFFILEGNAVNVERSIVIFAKRVANKVGPTENAITASIKTNFAFTIPYLNSIGMYIPYTITLNNNTVNIPVKSRLLDC